MSLNNNKADHDISLTSRISSFIRDVEFSDCPEDAVEMAKECIIDIIGVTVAGADEAPPAIVKEYVTSLGSRGEATVLGSDETFSPPHAALINGVQGHALDFDDTTFYTFSLHPSVTLVPTLLAAGEVSGASGRDIIASFVSGFEFQVRVPGGVGGVLQQMGYHPTGTVGVFGAAVGAGRLLGLDQEEFQHAIGIASSLYSGLISNYGTMTKPYHSGIANQNGMKAAMLAQSGFTANPTILDEPAGPWLDVDQDYEIEEWCEDLGEQWYTSKGIGIKKYPSCACTHGAIDAAITIHEQLDGRSKEPGTVDSISVRAAQSAYDQLTYDFPSTDVEAKFSMPYCVSAALLDGDVSLDHFTEQSIQRTDIRSLLEKTTFVADDEYANEGYISEGYPANVTVRFSDGTAIEESVFEPSGTPLTPISEPELEQKFEACASRKLDNDTVGELYDKLTDLEEIEDINDVTALL